ncbi:hypothetical protein [Micromonospora fulviviridis]|uniref:hypothetical protein n=1 Tax=Micromonospora fulviviridis TaxID=47860 RepID=UPI00379C926D
MTKLAEETLVAVGRMTVAATELEHVLSRIGAGDAIPLTGLHPVPGYRLTVGG